MCIGRALHTCSISMMTDWSGSLALARVNAWMLTAGVWVNSSVFRPSALAHPFPWQRGQLQCGALVGCRVWSPVYCSWGDGPVLLLLWFGTNTLNCHRWHGEWGACFSHPCHHMTEGEPQGRLACIMTTKRVSSSVPGGMQGTLSCVLQLRGTGMVYFFSWLQL